jgi:protein required for attachment to host cells
MTPHGPIPHDALVLVSDGKKALFFRNKGKVASVNLIVEQVFEQDNPANREQGTDQPGRAVASAGGPRSAMEETDWHRLAEERFAAEIADKLYQLAHTGGLRELIVVAPPKALGDLRKSFHKEVADRIAVEIPKDLTSHPVEEIERALAG